MDKEEDDIEYTEAYAIVEIRFRVIDPRYYSKVACTACIIHGCMVLKRP